MDLLPATAREALLQIRLEVAQAVIDSEICGRIDHICRQGLNLSGMSNFELTDQLADRLAEAHNLLKGVVEGFEEGAAKGNDPFSPEFKAKFYEALALPPDLEAMIERRIPR